MKSKNDKLNYFLFFTIVALVYFSIYSFFGSYYEDYESMFPALISGKYSDNNYIDSFYYIAHIGLVKIYAFLYSINNSIAWYDYIMHSFLFFSLLIVLNIARTEAKKVYNNIGISLLVVVLIFISLFAESIINWNFTRVAFMLCGAAIYFLYDKIKRKRVSKLNLFFTLTLFSIGTLTRPEVGVLMLIFAALFYFTYFGRKIVLIYIKQIAFVFLLPVLFIFSGITIDRFKTDEFYKLVEPELEYQVLVRRNVVDKTEMKTERDSMLYIAALAGINNDPKNVSIAFLKSIVDEPSLSITNKYQLERATNLFTFYFIEFYYIAFLDIIIVILISCLYWRKKFSFQYYLYALSFWILAFIIAYFIKMESRVFSPFIGFYSLGNVFFLYKFLGTESFVLQWRKRIKVSVVALYLFGAVGALVLFNGKSNSNIAYQKNNDFLLEDLKVKATGKKVLLDVTSVDISFSATKPFKVANLKPLKALIPYDCGVLSLMQPYNFYLDNLCNCNSSNMGQFYKHILKNKEEYVFLSSMGRTVLIKDYLSIIHNLDVEFVVVDSLQDQIETIMYNHNDTKSIIFELSSGEK